MHNSSRTQRRAVERRIRKAARKAAAKAADKVIFQASVLAPRDLNEDPYPEPPPSEKLRNRLLTEGRLKANRANALLSTGPQTVAGKATSSLNRRVHGLTVGTRFQLTVNEDPALYAFQRSELIAEYQPTTPSEHLLVERMAQHNWLQERALHLQAAVFGGASGEIMDEKRFALYERYALNHERAFHRNLILLLKLQKERKNQQVGFVRSQQQADLHPHKLNRVKLENELREYRLQQVKQRNQSAAFLSIPVHGKQSNASKSHRADSAPQNAPFLRPACDNLGRNEAVA